MKTFGNEHSRSRSRSKSRKNSRSHSNSKQNQKSHSNSISPKNFSGEQQEKTHNCSKYQEKYANDHNDSYKSKKQLKIFYGICFFSEKTDEVKRDDLTCLVLNLSGTTTESDIFKFLTKVIVKK